MNPSLAQDLADLLDRDLRALVAEIEAYPSEEALWRVGGDIRNSGGTLALHLAGNLRHFVGAVLGGSGYVRDREGEFGDRGVPRAEILRRVEAARTELARALTELDAGELDAPYPSRAPASLGEAPSTRRMLLHLSGHLMYHLGQVNYHRRLLGGDPTA